MVCEPLRLASFGGYHVYVRVAVILGGKGDSRPVRREVRRRFVASVTREARRRATIPRDYPEIFRVPENDVGGANGRFPKQKGFLHVGCGDRREEEER